MSSSPSYLPHGVARGPQATHGWPTRIRLWWRELDKLVLALVLVLMAIGTVAVAAASPASAERLSTAQLRLDELHFFRRHVVWQIGGLALMLGVSTLSVENARRLGVVLAGVMLVMLMLVPIVGVEKNGAQRWLEFGISFQPSEFLKPGFAIALAWVLSLRLRDPQLPVIAASSVLMALVAALLMMQPNLGATVLFGGVWLVLMLLAGLPLQRLAALIGAALGLTTLAYMFYDNARHRIDSFFGGGTAYDQVDLAERTLLAGGWSGTGLWLGTRKMSLPEAHTDYIFSVIGEEFGLIACALVVVLYMALTLRVLLRLVGEEDLFVLLAAAGLVTQIGGQAFINILVNLQLFPSKGMTLPLISYGGSSTLAVCLALGLLLALTRRNPYLKSESGGLAQWIANLEASGTKDKRS